MNTYKKNDSVECVDTSDKVKLSKGCIYTVLYNEQDNKVGILNDYGNLCYYNKKRFKPYIAVTVKGTPTKVTKDSPIEDLIAYGKSLLDKDVSFYDVIENIEDVFYPNKLTVLTEGRDYSFDTIIEDIEDRGFCVVLENDDYEVPVWECTLQEDAKIFDLTDDYDAEIYGTYVVVGCQKITKAKILELVKLF